MCVVLLFFNFWKISTHTRGERRRRGETDANKPPANLNKNTVCGYTTSMDSNKTKKNKKNERTKQTNQTMAMPVLLMEMMRACVETTQFHRHELFGVAFLWTAGRDVGWTVLSLSLVVVLSPEKKAQTDGPNDCLHQLANRPVRLSCPSCPSFSLFLLSHLLRRPVTQSIRQPASHIGFLHLTSLSAVRMDWRCQILSFFFHPYVQRKPQELTHTDKGTSQSVGGGGIQPNLSLSPHEGLLWLSHPVSA